MERSIEKLNESDNHFYLYLEIQTHNHLTVCSAENLQKSSIHLVSSGTWMWKTWLTPRISIGVFADVLEWWKGREEKNGSQCYQSILIGKS